MERGIDKITQAFIDYQAMAETVSYLQRGRRFEGLSADDLDKEWAAAFTAVCAAGDGRRGTDLEDLGAELGLRKLQRPEHLVSPEAMRAAQERVMRLGPQLVKPVTEAIGRFREDMNKPKN